MTSQSQGFGVATRRQINAAVPYAVYCACATGCDLARSNLLSLTDPQPDVPEGNACYFARADLRAAGFAGALDATARAARTTG